MRQVYHLSTPYARKNCIQAIQDAPEGYRVEIRPQNRSLDQNAKLHAVLADIAKTAKWAGSFQSVETWKRLLTAAWLRSRGESPSILPSIDGNGVDIVFRHTSDLTKEECSELIEYVLAWFTAPEAA